MKMPQFLTGLPDDIAVEAPFLIGESGFTLASKKRPVVPLSQWTHGEIPQRARAAIEAQREFANVSGLIRVTADTGNPDGAHAQWVLARTANGLLSIVVQDAAGCDVGDVRGAANFAVAEGKRYAAVAAIVFLQQGKDEEADCRNVLEESLGMQSIKPDRLYKSTGDTDLPVWFALLSHTVQ